MAQSQPVWASCIVPVASILGASLRRCRPGLGRRTSRCPVPLPSQDLHRISQKEGYLGGLRLLQATCKRFFEFCSVKGIALSRRNFTLSYDTNIPRQVGLAGSSAIVTAVTRCLMRYGFACVRTRPGPSGQCSRPPPPGGGGGWGVVRAQIKVCVPQIGLQFPAPLTHFIFP